jgi:hypothetical protein
MNKETKERILNLPIINLFYQLVLIKRAIEKVNKEKKINFSANFIMICYFFIIGFYIPFSFMLGPIFLLYFFFNHYFILFYITLIEIVFYLMFALFNILKNTINKKMIIEYLKYIFIGILLSILIFVIL